MYTGSGYVPYIYVCICWSLTSTVRGGTEWSTLLTVIVKENQLRRLEVGEDHPTVISFDLGLYEKVVKLLVARADLKHTVVPRLGELHIRHGCTACSQNLYGELRHRLCLDGS